MAKATTKAPGETKAPVGTKAPASADAQVEAQKALLAKFSAIAPPVLATGGDLSTLFSQDLATVDTIRVNKDGKKWITIHGGEKETVVKLHPAQYRALVWTALAFVASARSDRGFAYITWAAANKAFLEENLGKCQIEISTPKSTVTKILGTVTQFLTGIDSKAKILLDSVKLYPPVKGVGTRHSTKNEDYELVI